MRFPAASLLLLSALLLGCDLFFHNPKNENGQFLAEPINLSDFNSEFDDYNSALPSNKYGVVPLIFSSKRALKTKFNLVYEVLNLGYDEQAKRLTANNRPYGGLDVIQTYAPLARLVSSINGDYNVLGPNALLFGTDLRDSANLHQLAEQYLFLYADDRDGNLNVRFWYTSGDKQTNQGPFDVKFLNGPADDAYPTFLDRYGLNVRELYFTSNRDGNFDIYRVVLPQNKPLLDVLRTEQALSAEKVEILSSPADDKCPFVYNNTMVFTSNRPGGSGGFDLYVSRYENGQWSKPENAGTSINTQADEYRPVLVRNLQFTYNLMVFSSNRPGGKGGFDLYLVGLKGYPF